MNHSGQASGAYDPNVDMPLKPNGPNASRSGGLRGRRVATLVALAWTLLVAACGGDSPTSVGDAIRAESIEDVCAALSEAEAHMFIVAQCGYFTNNSEEGAEVLAAMRTHPACVGVGSPTPSEIIRCFETVTPD